MTPSAETKAAYIGEFRINVRRMNDEGYEHIERVDVPWTTIKEIMKAISDRAALAPAREALEPFVKFE